MTLDRTAVAAPRVGLGWWLGAVGSLLAAILIAVVIGPADIGFGDATLALIDPPAKPRTVLSARKTQQDLFVADPAGQPLGKWVGAAAP